MADQVEGLIDVPREFVKEGIQFMNKCQKRELDDKTTTPLATNWGGRKLGARRLLLI